MSTTSEFEPVARQLQDYGPTTSTESVYEHVLDHKLAENMSVPSIRAPVLRAVPISPTSVDHDHDAADPENMPQVASSEIENEVEYHIAEKSCDTDMTDSLAGLVRIEESVDNVGRITYPIIQETDCSSDNYVENASTTLIQAPLSTAIVQNVAKLPQNFTINMDSSVGNITTIQNVSQDVSASSQTLWLPTILATSAGTEGKPDEDGAQTGMSQIIITSESYMTNEIPRRANVISDTSFINRPKASKVQILSNISIPKTPTYAAQFPSGKEIAAPIYSTQNHVYKLNTNVVPQKHFNNSVLNTKTSKNQSLIGCPTVINNTQVKSVTYGHPFTKSTNINKVNKVNNGATLNTSVAASTPNTQCHILSRVVSGPNKLSVHTGRKSASTFKGSKNAGTLSGNQKQSRAIKIIQQTGSAHKTDKNWPVASVATYKSQQPAYSVVDTSNSKIIQKVGSPTHKLQPMPLQKVASKGERLILQSPCGPVLISTAPISTSLAKGPHYVQSTGPTPNLRYVHTYSTETQMSQAAVNQQLTAQILQSLSQPPKRVHHTNHIINHTLPPVVMSEDPVETKPVNQKRIVFGDPTTLLTTDDVFGNEERPNLSEEFRRYSFQPLAFVMLDHTYSLPAQKQPSPTPVVTTTAAPTVPSPTTVTSPPSPMKKTSPVVTSTASYELSNPITTSVIGPTLPSSQISTGGPLTYKSQMPQQDDDAGSVISSLEGDRNEERGGSDTETAPEIEEEGKTRCICDFTHDDGYMICCDRCGEWQHVDCMGIDRNNIPDAYMCEICLPRHVDRRHARSIQMRKREELSALGASDTDSSDCSRPPGQRRKRLLTVTTYTNTSGTSMTTYTQPPPATPPAQPPTVTIPKRGPKRPKKPEIIRKGTKRKLAEKRVKRKKDLLLTRNKFNSTVSSQSHWQESYESAVTNHYSPELRAKMMKYSGKLSSTANMAAAVTAHVCTTVPHAGGKILIATKDLKDNTPIVELRGKYMLSNQHRPQLQSSGRLGGQKPGPFVFFYRLPKDNIQICIDTRTYGNEARFVRRSCKPNAELQHCITKGALHVYLVTTSSVQSDTEITVGHDNNSTKQPCACGNPKHCKVNGLTPMIARRNIDYAPREKRSRNRCSSSSSPASPPPVLVPNPVTPTKETVPFTPHVKSEKKSPIKKEDFSPMSPIKHIPPLNFDQPIKDEPELPKDEDQPMKEIDLIAKEEMKPDFDEPDFVEPKVEPPVIEKLPVEKPIMAKPKLEEEIKEILKEVTEPENGKKFLEEKKIVEKVIEEKQEVEEQDKNFDKEEENEVKKEPELFSDDEKPPKREKFFSDEHKTEDKILAKSACHDRSSRSSRTTCVNQDSLDDKTDDSQDKTLCETKEKDKRKMTREERKMEAIMKAFERMEKAQQRKQEVKERQKRRDSDPHPSANEKEDDDTHKETKKRRKRKGRARTTSQSNRRRLNSADSDMVTSGDEAIMLSPRGPPSRRNSSQTQHNTSEEKNDSVGEDVNLSSACLLVEAAVGSVESAFKLPKTKKSMVTEWVGRSPERTPSPYRSPYRPSLVPATSLESLVRVASTMIGDLSGGHSEQEDAMLSPPRTPGRDRSKPPKKFKRVTRSTPPTEVVEVPPAALPLPQHSAKKRWLRQAISEESDSPNVDAFVTESPPNEMVTPLKKRRLARESLSCEQNNVTLHEETSPNFPMEDSPVKEDKPVERPCPVRNLNDTLYTMRDRSRSDSGQGSDDQSHLDHDVLNVDLKVTPDSENIRRIIGVPGTEDVPPAITKIEDIKSLNNNVGDTTECDDTSYNKVVPMEIDTTILPQPQIKDSIDSDNKPERTDSPQDKLHSSQSADTSGNSSPQRDEMDDIQKKIHSFHTENILMLKSRNKKPPKEKRKKVNLNFDLNMVDDQIRIQLRTEDNAASKSPEINGDVHDDVQFMMENIPLPPVETIPLPNPETIPLPADPLPIPPPVTIPLPQDAIKPVKVTTPYGSPSLAGEKPGPAASATESPSSAIGFLSLLKAGSVLEDKLREEKLAVQEDKLTVRDSKMSLQDETLTRHDKLSLRDDKLTVREDAQSKRDDKPSILEDKPSILENSTLPFSSRFSSTGLFSGIFSNINQTLNNYDSQASDNIPNMQMIKSAIDRSTSLDSNIFDHKDTTAPVDELKNVQEILSRVNSMDSNNSVLLCGVLKGSEQGTLTSVSSPPKPAKPYCPRTNDPRLNPPPADKPKPVRRKLSISEYRKRHKGCGAMEGEARAPGEASNPGEWSSESSGAGSLSPLRLEAAAAAAADDLEQRLHRALSTATTPKGVFDAQPTASERQREKLSARLRREFGLSLPDDEAARPPTEPAELTATPATETKRCER